MSPSKSDTTQKRMKRAVKTTPPSSPISPEAAAASETKQAPAGAEATNPAPLQEAPAATHTSAAESEATPRLTEKQQLFCIEYLKCRFNGTQAAINAGYSPRSAASIADENLRKPEIQDYLTQELERQRRQVRLESTDVLTQIMRLGFSDVRKLFGPNGGLRPVTDLDEDVAAAVQSVKVVTKNLGKDENGEMQVEYVHEYKLADKKCNLEMLARYLQLFAKEEDDEAKKRERDADTQVKTLLADLITSAKTSANAQA